jgi:CheY-like chemotaxis protein
MLATALRQAGADVETAGSVTAAMASLGARVPDAIVSDIAMPQQSGYDLVRLIRSDPRLAAVPVLALTAYTRAEDRDIALGLGFTAYLGKPVEPAALVAAVAKISGRE